MANETQQPESRAKREWGLFMGGIGSASAIVGLLTTLAGGVAWYITHRNQHAESKAKMALAETQARQAEYQASVQSYADILKTDPLYRPALDEQLNTAMQWTENFSVTAAEGESTSGPAASLLDEIMPILDAGLTRAKGPQVADIQAHIGWAHWLNRKIAEREFGPAAEQDLRAALATDPNNVYANAMLGNWLLQNGGSLAEAVQHFNTAIATGKARPFARTFQVAGLLHLDRTGARAALIQAVNDMRKNGEPLDEDRKERILEECFNPVVTDHGELAESLSAVPPDDAWQTYLWLDSNPDGEDHTLVHDFVNANLLELSGRLQESLAKYTALQQALSKQGGTMKDLTDAAVKRLSAK